MAKARIYKMSENELRNNEELKEYLDQLRSICYDLYMDTAWSAAILQKKLANIKGIKNTLRARIISGALKTVSEAFKIAGAGCTKTWTLFEQRFSEELSKAPKKPTEEFKIV